MLLDVGVEARALQRIFREGVPRTRAGRARYVCSAHGPTRSENSQLEIDTRAVVNALIYFEHGFDSNL
jgi:hypothetical protein